MLGVGVVGHSLWWRLWKILMGPIDTALLIKGKSHAKILMGPFDTGPIDTGPIDGLY